MTKYACTKVKNEAHLQLQLQVNKIYCQAKPSEGSSQILVDLAQISHCYKNINFILLFCFSTEHILLRILWVLLLKCVSEGRRGSVENQRKFYFPVLLRGIIRIINIEKVCKQKSYYQPYAKS